MNWEILVILLGAIGGLEGIRYILNWRANRRSELARATGNELQTLKDTCEFLQRQLLEKEQRFVEQTELVRKVQREYLLLTQEKALMEIAHTKEIAAKEIEMATVRCDDIECPFRVPPTAHTPPKPGLSKEKYVKLKNKKSNEVKPASETDDNEVRGLLP